MANFKEPGNDTVFLRKFSTSAVVGPDRWHSYYATQPVEINIEISKKRRIVKTRGDDNVDNSIRYDILEAAVSKAIDSHGNFGSLPQLVNLVRETTNNQENVVPQDTIVITVRLPKSLLLTDGIGYSVVQRFNTHSGSSRWALPSSKQFMISHCLFVENLHLSCVIGMLSQERPEKQAIIINLWLYNDKSELLEKVTDELWAHVRSMNIMIEASNYATLEALATAITRHLLTSGVQIETVTVAISKPSALTFVEHAGIEITRCREDFISYDS